MANVDDMTETLNAPTTAAHTKRIDIYDAAPELYAGMMAFSNAASKELDSTIGELIKIRASQINHCAFCLDMHVADARKQGETEQRLALVAAWEEAGDLFTDRERAALELTEAITEHTGCPCQVLNPFDGMSLGRAVREQKMLREAPSYLTACGLAMRRFLS